VHCIVTAGPTFEPLDQVRRLTNFSTGRLGTELANHLAGQGHQVILLVGEQATWPGPRKAQCVQVFTTTADLREQLQALAGQSVDAVFHAAAVSDFTFVKTWARSADGAQSEIEEGKISTSHERLFAELVPTPKIIARLRDWFPLAAIVGWKYEVDGNRESTIAKALRQIEVNRTDACVANGPGYGPGFGLVSRQTALVHLPDREELYAALANKAQSRCPAARQHRAGV
jgi:phosphopantothenate---cysteine ligase (CTP)